MAKGKKKKGLSAKSNPQQGPNQEDQNCQASQDSPSLSSSAAVNLDKNNDNTTTRSERPPLSAGKEVVGPRLRRNTRPPQLFRPDDFRKQPEPKRKKRRQPTKGLPVPKMYMA